LRIGEEAFRPLAELGVRQGVNLQPGQTLVVMTDPDNVGPARAIVRAAYEAGARHVHVLFQDQIIARTRMELAPEDSLTEYPAWLAAAFIQEAEAGAAFLTISSGDPDAFQGVDPARITTVQRTAMKTLKPFADLQMADKVAWSIISSPSDAWAAKVFPDKSPEAAFDALWAQILKCSHADGPDPAAAWKAHAETLNRRRAWLDEIHIESLHFKSSGTDLTIHLPKTHKWGCTGQRQPGGHSTAPNIPTEEVFTLAQRDAVEGTVRSTRTLHHAGQTIDGMCFTFEDGRVVEAHADVGEEALRAMLETDDGAGRLGEVALVPKDSPIAASGIEFHNTLYDENASCHLAFGRAYAVCLKDGDAISSDEDMIARGGNMSLVHVDFMVGSGDLDITARTTSGATVPVFRDGTWASA